MSSGYNSYNRSLKLTSFYLKLLKEITKGYCDDIKKNFKICVVFKYK